MKKRKLRKLAIICILVLILIVIFMLFFNPFLHLSLKGKKIITVEVNESFKDPLVNATFFGKDVSDDVSKTKIKTDKIGRWITYMRPCGLPPPCCCSSGLGR